MVKVINSDVNYVEEQIKKSLKHFQIEEEEFEI